SPASRSYRRLRRTNLRRRLGPDADLGRVAAGARLLERRRALPGSNHPARQRLLGRRLGHGAGVRHVPSLIERGHAGSFMISGTALKAAFHSIDSTSEEITIDGQFIFCVDWSLSVFIPLVMANCARALGRLR